MKKIFMGSSVACVLPLALSLAVSANAFKLMGVVQDMDGTAIEGASVTLLKRNLSTVSDVAGTFTFTDEASVEPTPGGDAIVGQNKVNPGYISVNGGVLSYSQSYGMPVHVQIFDMMGNRLLDKNLQGSGVLDLYSAVSAQGNYFARVSVGSARQSFKFTAGNNLNATFASESRKALLKLGKGGELQLVKEGYDTLFVKLSNLDTLISVKMTKSGDAPVAVKPAPADTGKTPEADQPAQTVPEYSYGWGLKNDPVPTRGCGKTWSRVKSGSYDFQWSGGKRTIRIDIPDNYDNNKPYRLVFGMHCMGGWAGGVQQEGYYGLKPLDTEKTTIFVAPEGNGNQAPWAESDYRLFDELLADLEGNLCIDSSRVFSTGFSYGSMFSNGLSWNHQDVLRAVAVYETAERNIWLPQHSGKGIGWMGVLGLDDGLCTPEMGRSARDIILKHNGADGSEKASEAAPGGAHSCYDYTSVEERFPVRWCTQSGGHIWDHKDPGQTQSWVPKTTWDFINKF